MTDLLHRPLHELVAAIRARRTTAEALVTAAIESHDRHGRALRAYQTWDPERALEQARAADAASLVSGPLSGLPVAVKDLFGVDGYPTYAGLAERLPAEWEREGFLIRALREQSAVVVGKTQMVELAFGGLGTNPHWGTPVNPWDAEAPRVPGGSSSGAGVSLWEGSAVIALGTDTAGSIRIPASMTGVVGHKTTFGRWPTDGVVPLSPTLDSVGALTRTVADAAWFFAAVDPRHGDPEVFLRTIGQVDFTGVRIGVGGTGAWGDSQDDIVSSVRAALAELEARGARLVDVELPEFDLAFDLYMSGIIVPPECAKFVTERLPGRMNALHPSVGERLRGATAVTEEDYSGALARRLELATKARERLRDVDVFATPTVPITPPRIADVADLQNYLHLNRQTSRATNPVNVLGLCALSVPCGLDGYGMPVGLQLVARGGEDERLLGLGLAAERVLGSARERLGVPALVR